jgi:hypothetical protein
MSIVDPDDPYRHLDIGGRAVEATESGADAHIDALAKKYLVEVRPERVQGRAP